MGEVVCCRAFSELVRKVYSIRSSCKCVDAPEDGSIATGRCRVSAVGLLRSRGQQLVDVRAPENEHPV